MQASAEISVTSSSESRSNPLWPATLWIGLTIIGACELLLFADVYLTGRGAIHSTDACLALPPAVGVLAGTARWMAVNMTAIVWVGLIFVCEGILAMSRQGSPARSRPHHFATLAIGSIFIWCVFDVINFYVFFPRHAWVYIGIPSNFPSRLWGYVLAFATIIPGMLMLGQIYLNRGWFNWARRQSWRMPGWVPSAMFLAGVGMLAWPLLCHDPVSNFTLWTSLVFLLDPINLAMGRPSMLRDWQNGWYGRTLAACAGGLTCGFLWEFWNYWAIAKWVYDLPFLGRTLRFHYFEMPVVGLLGFIPFGMECWVMWQTLRTPLDGLVEPLPDELALL